MLIPNGGGANKRQPSLARVVIADTQSAEYNKSLGFLFNRGSGGFAESGRGKLTTNVGMASFLVIDGIESLKRRSAVKRQPPVSCKPKFKRVDNFEVEGGNLRWRLFTI